MKIKFFFIILGIVFLIKIPTFPQDYSQDYGISGSSGIVWETMDYKIVDFVSEIGVSQGAQSSTDYSVEPVIGLEEESTAAKNWMLYL